MKRYCHRKRLLRAAIKWIRNTEPQRNACYEYANNVSLVIVFNDGVKRSALMGQDPGDTFAGKGIIYR
jgi:hypothetical protein